MLKWASPHHGRLLTPRHRSMPVATAEAGIPWAVDNDCFNGFNPGEFQKTCLQVMHLPGCLFVNAPDVFDKDGDCGCCHPSRGVGDHDATLELWHEWYPFLRMIGQPLSFVLQNGATIDNVPWDQLDVVFIGGCTSWKLGIEAEAIVREAKRRGKWVHMGRVNSLKRMRYAAGIGVDSCDGTGWAKHRDANMPLGLRAAAIPVQWQLDIT